MTDLVADPGALADRLSERLRERGWGYEDFHRKVRDASGGVRGTSYGSVWAYANGKIQEPRPRVVRAMAEVLGVTYDWLMTGRGPRTVQEAARTEPRTRPAGDRPRVDRVARLLEAMDAEEGRVATPGAGSGHDRVVQALVIDLLESDGLGLDRYAEGEVREAVRLVSWLLTFPLAAIGEGSLSPEVRRAYLLSTAAAVRLALPASPDGRPLNILDRMRRLRAITRAGRAGEGPTARVDPGTSVDPGAGVLTGAGAGAH